MRHNAALTALLSCLTTNALRLHGPILCSATAPAISFASNQWPALEKHLNTLPVFTCVNNEAEPLGYERDGKPLAIYFADVERAQQELSTMGAKFPQLGLRLIGVGLGAVFRQHMEGSALLVPSQAALAGTGDEEWTSETLPLYTCLSLSSQVAEYTALDLPVGAPTTPLFLDPGDAQASLEAAREAAKARGMPEQQLAQLQLMCTSLPQAVEIVLSGREADTCGDRFQFVAPRRSLAFLRDQQQGRQGASPPSPPPLSRREAAVAEDNSLIFPST